MFGKAAICWESGLCWFVYICPGAGRNAWALKQTRIYTSYIWVVKIVKKYLLKHVHGRFPQAVGVDGFSVLIVHFEGDYVHRCECVCVCGGDGGKVALLGIMGFCVPEATL